jgi:anti-sigma B factor antagonist
MQCDVEISGLDARIAVSGEVDAHTSPGLQRCVDEAVAGGATSLVIDVTEMTFIDSSGLRVLVHARQRTADAGGRFGLHQPSDSVVRLLELTGLNDLLRTT